MFTSTNNITSPSHIEIPPVDDSPVEDMRFVPYVTNKKYPRLEKTPAMFTKYVKGPPIQRQNHSGIQSLGFGTHPMVFSRKKTSKSSDNEKKRDYKEVIVEYQYESITFDNRYYRLSNLSNKMLTYFHLVEDIVNETRYVANFTPIPHELIELNRIMTKLARQLEYNELLSKDNLYQYDNLVIVKATRFFRLLADYFKNNLLVSMNISYK